MVNTTSTSGLDELELTSGPYERGRTHGEVYSDEVAENIQRYLTVFNHYGADEETVYDQAAEFVDIIEAENGDYFTEMEGMADGADLDIEDVTVLNARWEVMYSAYAEAAEDTGDNAVPDGYTAFGAQPEITANGHTLIGQNWDWIPNINIFVMNLQADDVSNHIAMTEAGIVGGKIGVNEHGIGMLLNGLVAEVTEISRSGNPTMSASVRRLTPTHFTALSSRLLKQTGRTLRTSCSATLRVR